MFYLLLFILIIISEVIYLKIADKYNIIDKPNHRSSHTQVTIRGGGIIFPLSLLLWFVFGGCQYRFFVGGLMLISLISFADDIKSVSRRLRIIVHLIAVSIVFYQLNLFNYNLIWLVGGYILIIGIINAYNFMDGINGITGIYSLILIGTLFWINRYHVPFVNEPMLIVVIMSILVFNFFNCRKKAVCFAGDVGSVSMATIICFLLVKIVIQTSQPAYILLLAVYGIDTIFTIMIRLRKGENIFEAHRQHLYQLIVNKTRYPHLVIAVLYAVVQLGLNIILIVSIKVQNYIYLVLTIIMLIALYLFIRRRLTFSNT